MLSTNYDINLVKVKITQEDFKKGREWTYIYIYVKISCICNWNSQVITFQGFAFSTKFECRSVSVSYKKRKQQQQQQIMLTSYHHTWPLWFQMYVCYSPFRLLSGNRLKVLPRKAIILGFGPYDFGFGDVDSAVMWVRKCCKYKTKWIIPTIEFGSAASKLKLCRVTGFGTQSFNNRVFLDFRF